MKTVLKSKEIAHVWAHQKQSEGRSGNMSFRDSGFYSYSTCIARVIEAKGIKAFVVDSESFSITTSSHQSAVRNAIRDLGKSFSVHCGRRCQDLDFTPATLRDHFLSRFTEKLDKQPRIKAVAASQFLSRVAHLESAVEVCQHFGLGSTKLEKQLTKLKTEIEAARKLSSERQEKLNASRDAKWGKRRATQDAIEAKRQAESIALAASDLSLIETSTLNSAFGWNDSRLEDRPELLARVVAERERRAALSIQDWINNIPFAVIPSGCPVLLRLNDGEVETSKGARVAIDTARLTFIFATRHKLTGWHRNGESFDIGDYQLDAVNEFGIVAGCHRIAWDELNRFAIAMSWV